MTRLLVPSLILWLLALLLRPSHATCPPGTWLDGGVRASGVYECAPIPPARWVRTRHGGWLDASPDPTWAIQGEVYCTGRALTRDGMSVECGR